MRAWILANRTLRLKSLEVLGKLSESAVILNVNFKMLKVEAGMQLRANAVLLLKIVCFAAVR